MQKATPAIIVLFLFLLSTGPRVPAAERTFFVDPVNGLDNASGDEKTKAWKTLAKLNAVELKPGDAVVLSPGTYRESLQLRGKGTPDKPIHVTLLPGDFDFYPDDALALPLHISNTNDAPQEPKPIIFALQQAEHVRIRGADRKKRSEVFAHGKMMFFLFDHVKDVVLENVDFDYRRPTVSEFKVAEVAEDHAVLEVHPDSTYRIENDRLVWVGEGWEYTAPGFSQQGDPDEGTLWRSGNPLGECTKVEEIAKNRLRVRFGKNPGFIRGRVFQDRVIRRETAGGFVRNSKDTTVKDCNIYFMNGMGIVGQFTENQRYENIYVAPRKGAGRTVSCWADAFHFSGCKGELLVEGCTFSGLHDDPINVHGTYLRIMDTPKKNQVRVRFMHGQTYGFEAFFAGDEIAFMRGDTVREFGRDTLVEAKLLDEREMLLTLKNDVPPEIKSEDVIENLTWYPEVTIRRCSVAMDSCRGFLLTSRGKTLVEDCDFVKTTMHGILIEGNTKGWFESGPVRDVTIRGNRFIECAEPVIHIAAGASTFDGPIHQNIRIENNRFEMKDGFAVSSDCVKGLIVTGNTFSKGNDPVRLNRTENAVIRNNKSP